MNTQAIITLDVDWAPDFVIDFAANILIAAQVKASWFLTHKSPAVERLRLYPNIFELGIHPNFLNGSTHGKTESEIIRHCMDLAPQAKVMRTHGLVQNSNLLEKIVDETSIRVDTSLFLPHAKGLKPVIYYWENQKQLVRLPYMWEDDFEMVRPNPVWDLSEMIKEGDGLMIMDFHPIHIFLNSINLSNYRLVRKQGKLADVSEDLLQQYIQSGHGAGYAFQSAIEYIQKNDSIFLTDYLRKKN